jgi:hypothetical protein
MLSRAFFFGFFFLSTPALAANFCVQTFNVYGPAYASNVGGRLERSAAELLRTPCEATQFQELWRDSNYNNFTRALEPGRLAFVRADALRTGDDALTGLASGFAGQVLSAKSELFRVNNKGGFFDKIRDLTGVQKGFTLIEAKVDRGPLALYANLHTHPDEQAIRLAQISQLIDALAKAPSELPLVLNGDLNATPGTLELAMLQDVLLLRDTFVEANGEYGETCTYCAANPLSWSNEDRVIDFVLVRNSPSIELKAIRSEITLTGSPGDPLSDHYGVRTDLEASERRPEILDPASELVRARLSKAAATLKRAKKILAARSGAGFQEFAAKLDALETALKAGTPPPGLRRAFLTP